MKVPIAPVSALPTKGIYRPIVADYALTTAICELVDNAIDVWTRRRERGAVTVRIDIDLEQQAIEIVDDAGGVAEEELSLLVTPGATFNASNDDTIGIFGVGAKRAPIALAQAVRVVSRKEDGQTLGIEYDDDWIDTPSWDVPAFRFSNINPNQTRVSLSRLRNRVDETQVRELREHLQATYSQFIRRRKCRLLLQGEELPGIFFR